MMKRKTISGVLIFMLIFILLVWAIYSVRRPVACSQIEETGLRSLDFNETDVNEMLNWLEETNRASKQSVYKTKSSNNIENLKWQTPEGDYYATFYNDTLVKVSIYWRNLEPTGKEVAQHSTGIRKTIVQSSARSLWKAGPVVWVETTGVGGP